MLHRGFYSCLSERGSGKQLLLRGGTLRGLIDIRLSVFSIFVYTTLIGFSVTFYYGLELLFRK
jgi:hypothetical protein